MTTQTTKTESTPIAAKVAPAAKATPVATEVKSDKPKAKAKAKSAAEKAKTQLKPHQPTTIVPTPDNPAKSIVPQGFKKLYAGHNDTCGRPMNMELKEYTTTINADGREALDLVKLAEVAKANDINFSAYKHLNRGQQRMNVGNKLAGLLKQGKKVIIGKKVFANADKALAAPSAQ